MNTIPTANTVDTPGEMAGCFTYLMSAGLTDVGRRRKNNEDAFAMFPEHGAWFVADGMGGAEDGEVASQAVVDALAEMFKAFPPGEPLSLAAKQAWVRRAADQASSWIFERSNTRGKGGTGTTLAGVCFDPGNPGQALALHAGDSRVYRWTNASSHGGRLAQVTVDHSIANSLGVDDERHLSPVFRNMIMRAVGLGPSVQVDATPFQVAAGDWVVICSDGLSKMIPDARIASILSGAAGPEAAARALLDAALAAGGKDNVTVVAVKAGDLPEPLPGDRLVQTMPPAPETAPSPSDTNSTSETANTADTLRVDTDFALPSSGVRPSVLWAAAVIVLGAVILGLAVFALTGRVTGASAPGAAADRAGEARSHGARIDANEHRRETSESHEP